MNEQMMLGQAKPKPKF